MSSLTTVHIQRNLIEMVRTPAMFLSVALTPVAVMLFFFVPFIGDDSTLMTTATGTFVVFAALLACVVHVAGTTAYQRESSWGVYMRTLPGGVAPSIVSQIVVGMVVVAAAILPVVAVAGWFTSAAAPVGRVLLAIAALLVAVIVFTLLGLAIGYTMSTRATMIITSIGLLPLAVGGGMFFDPADTPGFIVAIAPFVPTGGATDLVLAALHGHQPNLLALSMLIVWALIFAALAVWGYQRDQGRRFH